MTEPIRVLQVVASLNAGGMENYIMNLYRMVDKSKVQFDFVVHTLCCGSVLSVRMEKTVATCCVGACS